MVLAWHGVEGLGTLYTVGRSYWGQLHASLSLSHNELTSSHGVGWGGMGWQRGQDSMAHESPYLFT
jgi:hypothetical protein